MHPMVEFATPLVCGGASDILSAEPYTKEMHMFDDPPVLFAAKGLDRTAHRRDDQAAMAAMAADPRAVCLPIWRGRPLFTGQTAALLPLAHPGLDRITDRIFLGLSAGRPIYCARLADWSPTQVAPLDQPGFADSRVWVHPDIGPEFEFAELRARLGGLAAQDAELLATAKALSAWHDGHGFCAGCGQPSEMTMSGWQRDCPTCGRKHFPRTDPVVIMLVTRGNELLLGRSPGWPEGMFSLLAGFMEPGETIEAAVRREVQEECGVQVGRVRYLASQPWPFPASLMIGCAAEALSAEIRLDPVEIAEALWVSREDLAQVFAGGHPRIRPPRKEAIAGFLMKSWLADRPR